jgi:hypothetical protein
MLAGGDGPGNVIENHGGSPAHAQRRDGKDGRRRLLIVQNSK